MNEMLDIARTALERYHDVAVDDDGTLTFAHGGVVCAVQGTELEEGLPVLNLAAGLEEKAMGTLLMLVVGGASSMRAELTSDQQD